MGKSGESYPILVAWPIESAWCKKRGVCMLDTCELGAAGICLSIDQELFNSQIDDHSDSPPDPLIAGVIPISMADYRSRLSFYVP